MEGVIAGFGIPLLDISVKVDRDFLTKYKLGANDSVQVSESQRALYNDISETQSNATYIPGGAAQNTIRVAQWILGTPNATTLFGCIGKDKFGDILREKAVEEGVHVCYEIHKELPTGKCAVLITDQNRCLCAEFAAAKAYSRNHLEQPENWHLVQKADIVYVTEQERQAKQRIIHRYVRYMNLFKGYFLHSSFICAKILAESSSRQDQTICFNLSAPYICKEALDHILEILPHVDILFGNETEMKALGKELDIKDCNSTNQVIQDVAEILTQKGCRPRLIVITQGENPTLVFQDSKITEYPVVTVPPSCIVDTCGAGDAFVGGFLSQKVQGKSLQECIIRGHSAASKMIQCQGIQIPQEKA